ncbi:unnamed protein product, partial [Notodromas monacha]
MKPLKKLPAGSETIRVFEDVDTWDEKIIGNGRQRAKIDPRIAGKIDVTSDDWEKPYVPDKQEDPLGIFSNPKLPQDDPVLVEYIRQRVLVPPSKMDYNLQRPEIRDPSEEEATTKFMMPAGSETIRVFEDVDTWDEKIIGNGRQRAKIDPRIAGKIDVTSDDWEKPYVPDKQEDPLGIFSNPKLPQDDPVLVEYIRQRVLLPPSKMDYNLQRPEIRDPSEEEATTKFMMSLLDSNLHSHHEKVRRGRNGESKNDTGQRVFFEAGALDGEIASRTLFLERFKGWTGLTVEMTLPNIKRYLAKHRKAWFAPVCLSPEPRPVKKQMRFAYDPKDPWLERTGTINKHKFDVADKRVLSSRLYIYT